MIIFSQQLTSRNDDIRLSRSATYQKALSHVPLDYPRALTNVRAHIGDSYCDSYCESHCEYVCAASNKSKQRSSPYYSIRHRATPATTPTTRALEVSNIVVKLCVCHVTVVVVLSLFS